MSPALRLFLELDLPAMLSATLAAVTCALLGNFLLLRRLSLLGDAISHAVLPGLVIAFIVTQSRHPVPMLLGAAASGLVTVLLVELLRRLTRLESGASMGVVFSILFALGVVLIERHARDVDLDPDCVLAGALETITWTPRPAPGSVAGYLAADALAQAPGALLALLAFAALAGLFVVGFFKELRIAAFDPALASALGLSAGLTNTLLMLFVAGAVVVSFQAVGSILVIAMLVCPPATARLLTDRLGRQLALSVALAVIAGVGGYFLAAFAPRLLGTPAALNAAGMIGIVSGLLLGLGVLASPSHGVLAKQARLARLRLSILSEDILAQLYRAHEAGEPVSTTALAPTPLGRLALRSRRRAGQVTDDPERPGLTPEGLEAARQVIRSHRLWETYLVQAVGLRPDHVHRTAAQLEHLGAPSLGPQAGRTGTPLTDPQGKPIPPGP
ncbi:MAG TPA: metal ABC transporter permease [Phycisphaerales bacterium]|nr:metal ABC transporter permease [Phycisphaerales bacterium]